MNNIPVSIYNIYKYLASLHKIGFIPEFKVEIRNNLTEAVFTFKYDEDRQSTITFDTNTQAWTSYTNVMSLDEIYHNSNFAYLFEEKMIGYDNETYMAILRSYDINDILEPSLTPFYINSNINLRDIQDKNKTKLHNLNYRHYYMFINNLLKNDKNMIFDKYKEEINNNIPNEMWNNIYQYYNPDDMNFNDFIEEFI